jgi:hypothetical protein
MNDHTATANDHHAAISATLEWTRRRLRLETLEERGSDRLDFHDISVASIRDIIEKAFADGYAAAKNQPPTT